MKRRFSKVMILQVKFLDRANRLTDDFTLVGLVVDDPLDKPVGQYFPAGLQTLPHQLRVAKADRGIQAHGGTDAVAVQNLLEAPEPNSETVVEPTEVGDVRDEAHSLGAGNHRPGHGGVDVPLFHVDNGPDRYSGVVGQPQRLPVKDW